MLPTVFSLSTLWPAGPSKAETEATGSHDRLWKNRVPDRQVRRIWAKCDCCKTFRSSPPGIDLKCRYDSLVPGRLGPCAGGRDERAERAGGVKRDFLLDLSEGFIYDCLHREAGRLDMADYRRWVLEQFRGTLCVDELHLGRYTLLLATDPLGNFPVAFALVGKNDQDHMRRFLKNLQNWGFSPQVVITDGSSLYPALLSELWPQAQHQLCVFHVLQDITTSVLGTVRRCAATRPAAASGGVLEGAGVPAKECRSIRSNGPRSRKKRSSCSSIAG